MLSVPNWKPVATRVGIGFLIGLGGSLVHHAWLAIWSSLLLSLGFSLSSVKDGEDSHAALTDAGLVVGGTVAAILLCHLL